MIISDLNCYYFAIKCLLKVWMQTWQTETWLLSGLDFNSHYEFSILVCVVTAESSAAGSLFGNTFDSSDLNDC